MRRGLLAWSGLLLALGAAQGGAGDVRWSYRTDPTSVSVDVDNQSDGAIRVKSVALRFFDMGGTPMGKQAHACEGECDVAKGEAGAFGPYPAPEGWESVEVAEVAYESVAAAERPARRPPPR
jgi:hypothetical protein